jgi:MFS family permease
MPFDSPHRSVLLLAVCQALNGTAVGASFIVIALVGNTLADDKSLMTLPVALQFVAAMATTMPASLYMRRVGRRLGFVTGAAIACVGALVCAQAIFDRSFALFCLGATILGSFNAFAQYFRFAAADAASTEFRAKAISLVLAGGVVSAVTGPLLARLTNDLFAPVQYAGIYLSFAVLFLLIVVLMLFVRIPGLSPADRRQTGRALREIALQPVFLVAALAATAAYATMMLLMTVAPLAMAECNLTFADSAWMMQWHTLGMFAPSFVTGHLIKRFGVVDVMLWGALLLVATLAIDLAGVGLLNFYLGMAVLGVGWNFLFVGGTTLLTQTHTPAEAAKVQGFNDFLMWTSVTAAVLASGALQSGLGWTFVNVGVMPVVGLALAMTLWLKLGGRKVSPAI